jgi:hypothetical protein
MILSAAVKARSPLYRTLAAALPDLRSRCRDPWVVIGSAAARLAGAEVMPADIDVLCSTRDAQALGDCWQPRRDDSGRPADGNLFQSQFARFAFPGLPLEIMGGLQLHGQSGWIPVRIDEVITVDMEDLVVPIPSLAEQIRVLQAFGRRKDLQRAALLKSLCGRAL